jgi:hypothetical protein
MIQWEPFDEPIPEVQATWTEVSRFWRDQCKGFIISEVDFEIFPICRPDFPSEEFLTALLEHAVDGINGQRSSSEESLIDSDDSDYTYETVTDDEDECCATLRDSLPVLTCFYMHSTKGRRIARAFYTVYTYTHNFISGITHRVISVIKIFLPMFFF